MEPKNTGWRKDCVTSTINDKKYSLLSLKCFWLVVVVHACNPHTQEAEAGGLLQVWSEFGLQSQFKAILNCRVKRVSKIKVFLLFPHASIYYFYYVAYILMLFKQGWHCSIKEFCSVLHLSKWLWENLWHLFRCIRKL